MNCGNLPGTGGPSAWLVLAAATFLIAGWLLLRRHDGHRADSVILTLVLLIGLGTATPSPSQAATDDCTGSGTGTDQTLVITQTSIITGLGPTAPPVDIEGRVTNPSHDSTYVSTVIVSIGSVTKAIGAAPGPCRPADYVIANPLMTVDQPLPALSHVSFAGASIAFLSTSSNQDACKRATIHLTYVSDSR
ncbi:MAG: hypothetical protein JWQ70_789 [Aeromicrobium sp.]|nr:hypothetical protein [Aeromicrobium sp.]